MIGGTGGDSSIEDHDRDPIVPILPVHPRRKKTPAKRSGPNLTRRSERNKRNMILPGGLDRLKEPTEEQIKKYEEAEKAKKEGRKPS